MSDSLQALLAHQEQLRACTQCPEMVQPVIIGNPGLSGVISIGQAPGEREPQLGRPFAWTAGKQLFKWFESIGVDEESYREQVYMAAVCRCFPGKNPKGGDRVPDKTEIANCKAWLDREYEIIQPKLLIPIGKLAIAQMMKVSKLADVVGQQHQIEVSGQAVDVIPLPHPSGLSTWHRMSPGKELLQQALDLIDQHPAWQVVKQARKSQGQSEGQSE